MPLFSKKTDTVHFGAINNIKDFIANPRNLEWLDLSHSAIHSFKEYRELTDTERLSEIDETMLGKLATAFIVASPQRLSLNTQYFGDDYVANEAEGVAKFAAVMKAVSVPGNRIRELKLSFNCEHYGCEITPKMMQAIVAGLKAAPQLRHLSLKNHYIGKKAAKILANALPETGLSVLDLTNCGIRLGGIIYLLRTIPETRLTALRMSGVHSRVINRVNGMYGSMNISCGKAAVYAAKNSPLLTELQFPMDHWVHNAELRKRAGIVWDDKSAVKLMNHLHQALDSVAEQRQYIEGWAFRVYKNQLPVRVFSAEEVTFLQRGGFEAIRHALKNIYLHPVRANERYGVNLEELIDSKMQALQTRIQQYQQQSNQLKVFGATTSNATPVSSLNIESPGFLQHK